MIGVVRLANDLRKVKDSVMEKEVKERCMDRRKQVTVTRASA
jgi:ribosomal protein L15E